MSCPHGLFDVCCNDEDNCTLGNPKHVHANDMSEERVHKTEKNEHEPVAWYDTMHGETETVWSKQQPPWEGEWKPLYTAPPQRKEEPKPVKFKIFKPTPPRGAEMLHNIHNDKLPWVYDQDPASGNVASMWVTPVYTAPPRKEWFGLTDEEIEGAIDEVFEFGLDDGNIPNRIVIGYVRVIEAMLKEKNS